MNVRFFVVCFLTVLLAGCTGSKRGMLEMQSLHAREPFAILLEVPRKITTAEPVELRFVTNREGFPIDLSGTGRDLHIVIVSENLQDIRHIYNPPSTAVGLLAVQHHFTQPGIYRIRAEIDNTLATEHHGEFADLIASADVAVSGREGQRPVRWAQQVATVDGLNIELSPETVQAGVPVTLSLRVRDAEGNDVPFVAEDDPVMFALVGTDLSIRHGNFRRKAGVLHAMLDHTFTISGRHLLWVELTLDPQEGPVTVQVPYFIQVKPAS